MKKNILSILLSAVILYLISCEDNPVSNSNIVNKFAPYMVGAYWLYERPQQISFKNYFSEEVISKNEDGKYFVKDTYAFIDSLNSDTTYIIDTNYVKVTSEGIIFSPPAGMEVYILKQPFQTGNAWSYEIDDSLSYNFEIADDSFDIATPAGYYTGCLKVILWISDNSLPPQEMIFAPYVGVLKTGSYELVSYSFPDTF